MQYIIVAETDSGKKAWGFTKSRTGQIDFAGSLSVQDLAEMKDASVLSASTYWTQSFYAWLPKELRADITVHLSEKDEVLKPELFAFLTHAGALLLAVEAGDGLLAAELLSRRFSVFQSFSELTEYIVRPVAAAALFAWVYGRFSDDSNFENAYRGIPVDEDVSTLLFRAVQDELDPHPDTETPEAMFVRYFKTHEAVPLTLGIVGAHYRNWAVNGLDYLDSLMEDYIAEDFIAHTTRVRDARDALFSGMATAVQAEPYNPADPNAIAVMFDDLEASVSGMGGKAKAGYLRATGAAIIRKAHPAKYSFPAKLARLGNSQDGRNGVVVKITV